MFYFIGFEMIEKVAMITEHKLDGVNASSNRAQWEINAIKKNGFTNIELIEQFSSTKIPQILNRLVHAQQISGRFLKNMKYVVDAHGLEYIHSHHLSKGYPITSWRKLLFILRSYHYKKLETKIFKNSLHIFCAGEKIYDQVKNIQTSTIVNNAVFLDNYRPTTCKILKIALVGPFLKGKINFLGLDMIKHVVKNFEKIEFVVIGPTDQSFREALPFKNIKFTGKVDNYIDVLRDCSVLLAPYPDYAYYLGSKTKFLEAAALQIPIVTTPVGNLDFQNDYVCIGKNNDELVNQIEYLKDENIRSNLGKQLRNEINKNYNAEIESKKIIKIYKEIL